jgi:CubicO group peptidase (beta-lactamase class C family)
MNLKIILFIFVCCVISTNLFAQVADLYTHHEIKDSIVERFNRNEFKSIYQLADTSSFHRSVENLTRFLRNYKNNYGQILSAAFLSDSACQGCNSKRAKYYLLEFQLKSFLMVLEVTPSKKFSSFGLLNYTYPERPETSAIKTNNPLRNSFDLSIDSAAREYFRDPHATGLSIGIIKDGKGLIYHYGEITKGSSQLPTGKTIYEIGSITKTFTATILANAVLENRVRLDDDVRKYLPEPYPNLEYKGQAITFQDLSNHSARIPSEPDDYFTQPQYDPMKPWNDYSTSMLWQYLQRVVIDTFPGYKFQYSNVGVSVLGHILEKVYDLPFDELIKKYITDPLRMNYTGTVMDNKINKQMASKYSSNGNPVPYWSQPAFTPAGVGMHSCLDDMLNYLNAQIAEDNSAIRLTHQPTANNLGLGWGVGNVGTLYRKLEHNGATNGFASNIKAFPEIKTGFVILVNSDTDLAKLIRRLSAIIVK